MEKNTEKSRDYFILRDKKNANSSFKLLKKRGLIGSSDNCDIVLKYSDISPIHCVYELRNSKVRLFDMDSSGGTFINGEKIVTKELIVGDEVSFATHQFCFEVDSAKSALPPIFDAKQLPPKFELDDKNKQLPTDLPHIPSTTDEATDNYVSYPLSLDPRAEYSEYIFEDVETLYPIFRYKIDEKNIEVIILFKGKIFSVDYIPIRGNITYRLSGLDTKNSITYPYLNKNEKIDFIEIKNDQILIKQIPGYKAQIFNDSGLSNVENSIEIPMAKEDIVKLKQNDHEVYISLTDSPPIVKPAPLFRRDKKLRNNLVFVFTFVLLLLGSLQFYEVDEELKEEKIPERVATILYKKKKEVAKEKESKKVEKEIVKSRPEPKPVPKPTPKEASAASNSASPEVKKVTPEPARKAKKTVVSKAPTRGSPKRSQVSKQNSAAPSNRQATRRARSQNNNKGRVDTYKSVKFSPTISSFLSKGGGIEGAKVAKTLSDSSSLTKTNIAGNGGGQIESAKVSQDVGSLTGSAQGKLDLSKGAEGLVNKKSFYTAGIPSKTVILGSMEPDLIRKILRDHIPQFRYCYQRELEATGGSISGVITLDFVIGASGHVSQAGLDESSNLPSNVTRCAINVLKGIRFPEPRGGGTVQVKQPINFYPKSI